MNTDIQSQQQTARKGRWDWFEAVMSVRGPSNYRVRLTAVALFAHMDDGGAAFPSQLTLAARTGFGERSIRRHLDTLEREGWIERAKKTPDGRPTRKTYYLARVPESGTPVNKAPVSSARNHSEIPANKVPLSNELTPANEVPVCRSQIPAILNTIPANKTPVIPANEWPPNLLSNQSIEPLRENTADGRRSKVPKSFEPLSADEIERRKQEQLARVEEVLQRKEAAAPEAL